MFGVELVLVLWFAGLGSAVLVALGIGDGAVGPLAFIAPLIGLTVSAVLTSLLVVLGISDVPMVDFVGGALLSIAAAVLSFRRRSLITDVRRVMVSLALVAGVLSAIYTLFAPILTFDSYRFVMLGRSLDHGTLRLSESAVADFPLLVMHVQALASALAGEYSTYAVGTVSFLAIVGSFGLVARVRFAHARAWWAGSTAVAVVVMVSIYMLRVQFTYLNSHLAMAALLMSVTAMSLSFTHESHRRGLFVLIALALAGVCIARVEGLLVAVLLLLFVIDRTRPSRVELGVLAVVGFLPATVWYGAMISEGAQGDILSPGLGAAQLALVGGALLVGMMPATLWLRTCVPTLVPAGLALCLGGMVFVGPSKAATAVSAFTSNALVSGGWGPLWWLAVPCVATVVWARRRSASSFSLVTGSYVLLVVFLGAMRKNPYRLGWGDSGNRMLVHVVPTMLLFVLVRLSEAVVESREPAPAVNSVSGSLDGRE